MSLYSVFAKFLLKCEPNIYPGFSYSWLELFSNRFFMGTMLQTNPKQYAQLVIKLLSFVRHTVSDETLKCDHVMLFYKGVLRVFVVY